MGRFDGATVLITGAAGGLGRGAAKGFAAEAAEARGVRQAPLHALVGDVGEGVA